MPLFGAHMSIAGGYHKALLTAQAHRCDTVQMFTKSSNQWNAKALTEADLSIFHETFAQAGLQHLTAHDSYLINLASPDAALWAKSLEAFIIEVERADLFRVSYLVTHPGSPTDGDEQAGIARIVRALDEVADRLPKSRVRILLETTAGQGNSLGHRFEHLAALLNRVRRPERLGVCLDTCHVFAAGYPLGSARDYEATMTEFDRVVGIDQLRVFHVNDSQKPLGSRVDRHAHLGRGQIGLDAFRLLVNDQRFADRPMILETPKEEDDNDDMDTINLATLRGLQQ